MWILRFAEARISLEVKFLNFWAVLAQKLALRALQKGLFLQWSKFGKMNDKKNHATSKQIHCLELLLKIFQKMQKNVAKKGSFL